MKPVHADANNMAYIEELYQNYLQNPDAMAEPWKSFFSGMDFALSGNKSVSTKELDVFNLIQAYRDYGHFEANLNPLSQPTPVSDLDIKNFNLDAKDLESTFQVAKELGLEGQKLKDIIAHLKKSYCGTISVQVSDALKIVREWFQNEMEKTTWNLSTEQKKSIYNSLARTESLEKFLHTRFVGAKRFSIEGGDSMIPMLEHVTVKGRELGVEEFVIGMAHRGRLNVLVNYMDKAIEAMFAQFEGRIEDAEDFAGDVKYHLGYSADKETPHGLCHVSLAFNPSHLEAVNPVVCGMVRAKQRKRFDTEKREKVVPILIHGDAAFAGQGVVMETLQLAHLKGYTVGGTIHLIVDNQVGFTADPEHSRSSPYASDIGKALQVPVIHVNGDDPESCVRGMDMAIRFRQQFKRDVIINIICYRKFGHNEGDEPTYTQPQMYQIIKNHPTPREIYMKKLVSQKIMSQQEMDEFYNLKISNLQKILDEVRKNPPKQTPQVFGGLWKGLKRPQETDFWKSVSTNTTEKVFDKVAKQLTSIPKTFNLHPKLTKLVELRQDMFSGKQPLDWGAAELMAYGTLIEEGNSVRLSGQDCIRGTFTHRHSCFFDTQTGEIYNPLEELREDKEFCVYNSSLSEMGVLGFEYGNSSSDPTFLIIWEAQFGDFSNGAQIIIDQFIASGEQKWLRMSGLVMLLPHGYEGQGPEHSSARLERYLQLAAQNNIQVCNFTTPAQLFHALRRQIKRDFRVPLIVMSPKSLLRHPKVVSDKSELLKGQFMEVIPDATVELSKTEKIILVSGKLYYELLEKRDSLKKESALTSIIRVEQLYPYPDKYLVEIFKSAKNLKTVVWAQEEPQNMGSWNFIFHPLRDTLKKAGLKIEPQYAGRAHKASPATGSPKIHKKEQEELIEKAFEL